MFDVITIGAAVQDVFLISDAFQIIRSPKFETGLGECVALGSKIEVDQLHFSTGGAGTNCPATFASLRLRTAAITRVGNDMAGREILADLSSRGIDTSLTVVAKKGQTGYSTLLTTTDGERSVLVHRGVSAEFTKRDIPFRKLKAKWIYASSLAGNISVMKLIAAHAVKNRISLGWNPGSKELEKGIDALEPILKTTTYFSLNLEEARLLVGTEAHVKSLLNIIHRPGMILAITDGENGTYVQTDNDRFHIGTRDVPVVSRTGAGDAFNSGTVAALIKGMTPENALRIGTINAESVIGKHGTKNGILTRFPSQRAINQIAIKPLR